MPSKSWFLNLARRFDAKKRTRYKTRSHRRVGILLRSEGLEDRAVPTVLSTTLFFDQFDNNDNNVFSSNWSVVQGATHDAITRLNPPPPSNGYSIKLDVDG